MYAFNILTIILFWHWTLIWLIYLIYMTFDTLMSLPGNDNYQKLRIVSCFWMGGGSVDVVFNNKVCGLDRIIQVTVCWEHILSRRRLPIRPLESPCVQRVYSACSTVRGCPDMPSLDCEYAIFCGPRGTVVMPNFTPQNFGTQL